MDDRSSIIFNKSMSLESPIANPLTEFILGKSLIKAPLHLKGGLELTD